MARFRDPNHEYRVCLIKADNGTCTAILFPKSEFEAYTKYLLIASEIIDIKLEPSDAEEQQGRTVRDERPEDRQVEAIGD